MSTYKSRTPIEDFEVISRFGAYDGEQFEIRLRNNNGEWLAALNFRDPAATRIDNHYDEQGVPQFFVKPEQFAGTVDLLNSGPTWFTIYDDPLVGWISSYET